jgi:CheY-like chemotaxis protein
VAPIDLMVIDYAMPGMTGLDLVNTLRGDRPGLAFIMITGYADADLIGKLDGLTLLRKPYRMAELAREVNGALRRVGAAG